MVLDRQMGEGEDGDSTTEVRSLEVSISFGRFENDLLSWEKWSSFSQNKYLEEVEKCATPGSVAAKKAFFEARNKLIGVRKAEALNKHMEACQKLEKSEIQNNCVSEGDQYDKEVIEANSFVREVDQYDEENIFGSELSISSLVEHPELQTSVFVSHKPDEKDVIEAISTDEVSTHGTIPKTETCCALVDDNEKDSSLFLSKSEMLSTYNTDETTHESNLEFDKSTGRVQEEPILRIALSGCETDEPLKIQSFVLGSAQTDGEGQVENPCKIISQFDAYSNAPKDSKEESLLKSERSPSMLEQLKGDDVGSCKSPPQIENVHTKSKFNEYISALDTEIIYIEPASNGSLPDISAAKNTRTKNAKPLPQKSSKKIFPVKTQNSAENVKKILVSRVPGSPQTSTRKTSRPSVPTVKSAPTLIPVSRVKKIPASTPAVPKSPQIRSTTRSTLHSAVSSLKPSSLSPSKKRVDLLASRKKIISPLVNQKPTPKSIHMSLNLGSRVPGSVSGSTPGTEPRKSLFLEKMGDKDIVKRAFRAFQYMSTPLNIETNATSKKVVRDKTDVKPSAPLLEKEKDRLVKKSEVDMKIKKPALVYASDKLTHSKEDKRKEVKKVAEKTEHPSKSKECSGASSVNRRQSLTCKASTQPGLLKRQGLSKSLHDK